MIRFSTVELLESNVCLFSCKERRTAAGDLGHHGKAQQIVGIP